ncbi:MAG: hypothetical protein V4634_23485 [Pseudomonadota bacterium]
MRPKLSKVMTVLAGATVTAVEEPSPVALLCIEAGQVAAAVTQPTTQLDPAPMVSDTGALRLTASERASCKPDWIASAAARSFAFNIQTL